MVKNHFKLKSSTKLSDATLINESDLSFVTADDTLLQYEYVEAAEKDRSFEVNPGIYKATAENNALTLIKTGFTKESFLKDYINTDLITTKISTFFSKLDVYKEYDIFPKRGMLLYGPPGAGKSSTLSELCNKYKDDNDVLIMIWPTDSIRSRDIKNFIERFEYKNVNKFILIIEDLGGIESKNRDMESDASLLSLLDNVEQSFKIPTMIVATTNFPEMFLENLTNRPQRFDEVIEIKRPNGEFRGKFLEFFSKGKASAEDCAKIINTKYDVFSIAHIKEIVVRAALFDLSYSDAIDKLLEQSSKATNQFITPKKGMGMGR